MVTTQSCLLFLDIQCHAQRIRISEDREAGPLGVFTTATMILHLSRRSNALSTCSAYSRNFWWRFKLADSFGQKRGDTRTRKKTGVTTGIV